MAFRFEDRGLTLRLFVSKRDALAYQCAKWPTKYAVGWIAKNDAGRWIDADGVLPPNWTPDHGLLSPSKTTNNSDVGRPTAAPPPATSYAALLPERKMIDLKRLRAHPDNKTKRAMQIDGEQAAMAIDAALHEAIAAIYFDDSSKFGPALWSVVRILGGPSCAKLLEENPCACYTASAA